MYFLIYSSFVVAFGQLIVVIEFFSNVVDGVKGKNSKTEGVVEFWRKRRKAVVCLEL